MLKLLPCRSGAGWFGLISGPVGAAACHVRSCRAAEGSSDDLVSMLISILMTGEQCAGDGFSSLNNLTNRRRGAIDGRRPECCDPMLIPG